MEMKEKNLTKIMTTKRRDETAGDDGSLEPKFNSMVA